MNWLKENWFRLIIVICLLVITVSLTTYFLVYIPGRDQSARAEREFKEIMENNKLEAAAKDRQNNLTLCLMRADEQCDDNWADNCKLEGKKEDCESLIRWRAEALEKTLDKEKDNCFKQFK